MRSRHIKVRYFFVSHYTEAKDIELQYLPTEAIVEGSTIVVRFAGRGGIE